MNEEAIAAKKAEILNHERILRENGTSRWYDQSKRHLELLNRELEALEKPFVGDPPGATDPRI